MADQHFFLLRRRSWPRCAACSWPRMGVEKEVGSNSLVTPPDFDPTNYHFVKGEHLEFFPERHLDFPNHFHDSNAFAFRTLFWWGHHLVCALMLEGEGLKQHKARIVDRFHQLAGQGLEATVGADVVGMETW